LGLDPELFDEAWPRALKLYRGVLGELEAIDSAVSEVSVNWSLGRMNRVDRALLRLAYFEMRYRPEIPLTVSLSEALELAKLYGDSESGAFVNALLDRLAKSLASGGRGGARAKDARGKDAQGQTVPDGLLSPSEAQASGGAGAASEGGPEGSLGEDPEEAPEDSPEDDPES
jgi:transcription antitermination factor NusB